MATVPLAVYMWRRIQQVGVDTVVGVPGDFNLFLLDYLYDVSGLRFVGSSNELNASYAADGYARTKQTPGCIITTHGVGEMSAMNGIAGSLSENIPVIHVVGQIEMFKQKLGLMIHHSIGDKPDFQLFNKMSEPLRCSVAELHKEAANATQAIDRAIRDAIIQKKPAYIFFPADMAATEVPVSLLDTKLDLTIPSDQSTEVTVVAEILKVLYASKNPSVLVDFMANSHGHDEARLLVDKLNIPFYSTHGTKGLVDETHPQYVGTYHAFVSIPGLAKALGESDVVVALGWFGSDLNTAFYRRKIPPERRIDIQATYTVVQGKRFDNVAMSSVIRRLVDAVDSSKVPQPSKPTGFVMPDAPDQHAPEITQSQLWRKLDALVESGDVIHADTGTASNGCPEMTFPADVQYIMSMYWGSIGYSTASACGSDLALRDLHAAGKRRGRTVLITGDGSLMLTMQEVSVMVKEKLPVLILIINNDGYTVERVINGARQPYNDIPRFDYSHMLGLFGAADAGRKFKRVATMKDLEAAISDKAFTHPVDSPHVLEICVDKFDVPWKMAGILHANKPGYLKANGFKVVEWDFVDKLPEQV